MCCCCCDHSVGICCCDSQIVAWIKLAFASSQEDTRHYFMQSKITKSRQTIYSSRIEKHNFVSTMYSMGNSMDNSLILWNCVFMQLNGIKALNSTLKATILVTQSHDSSHQSVALVQLNLGWPDGKKCSKKFAYFVKNYFEKARNLMIQTWSP